VKIVYHLQRDCYVSFKASSYPVLSDTCRRYGFGH